MKIKCLIVDDEPLSLDILEKFIADIPELELVDTCLDAFEAMAKIKELNIDLIFLDINMPKLSGLNMVKSMENLPEIVFTTAYPEYAVDGFELNILDYLVKPISFERFVKTINKAQRKLAHQNKDFDSSKQAFMMVKENKKLYKLFFSDIKYIQSMGDFVKIFTDEKVYILSNTLKHIKSQLNDRLFVQIHKSYIISINAFKYLEGNQVLIGKSRLPIGLTYKNELLKALKTKPS